MDRLTVEGPVPFALLVNRAVGKFVAKVAILLQLERRADLHLLALIKSCQAGRRRDSSEEESRELHGPLSYQQFLSCQRHASVTQMAKGDPTMPDEKPAEDIDVTKEWRATHGQKGAATRLRLFAAIAWVVAIGGEIAGIVMLRQHKFDHGNLPLLIGLLVVIAVFAIAGSLLWKAANKHDPARESDRAKFFFQNQLGAIITLIAFLPLIVLIFMDKDMDPKKKKIAGGVGAVLAVVATLIGVSWNPPSVEQYTKDMNTCAAQIKAKQPTTACSPEVAAQAQDIAKDSQTVAEATRDATHPAGQDVVYWIAPENGAKTSATPHVFHICQGVSPLRGKTVNKGSVTEAYAENATRITKQIPMEQKQCGFASSTSDKAATPAAG